MRPRTVGRARGTDVTVLIERTSAKYIDLPNKVTESSEEEKAALGGRTGWYCVVLNQSRGTCGRVGP